MSIFVCEDCGCIENSATSRFWFREEESNGRALCSACDPKMGKWHGFFPQRKYDPEIDKPSYMDGGWTR